MKRRIIIGIAATLLLLTTALGSAAARGKDNDKDPSETFAHVDVRSTGSVTVKTITTDQNTGKITEVSETVPVEITDVAVKVDGNPLRMTGKINSKSNAYSYEYQSVMRNLSIRANAKIDVTCKIKLTYDNEIFTIEDTYRFTSADSNCEATGENRGIDLTVSAEKRREIIIPLAPTPTPTPVVTPTPTPVITPTPTPVVTPTPTPVVTPTPTPVVTPTPTPVVTPTPTPTIVVTAIPTNTPTPTPRITPTPTPRIYYVVPRTGEVTDMWLVILICTGLCAIAGIVLISVKRSQRNANRK